MTGKRGESMPLRATSKIGYYEQGVGKLRNVNETNFHKYLVCRPINFHDE